VVKELCPDVPQKVARKGKCPSFLPPKLLEYISDSAYEHSYFPTEGEHM